MKHQTYFVFLFFQLITLISTAQELTIKNLEQQLLKQDSLLFECGFNQCNFAILENVIAKNFEFYHDENGIQTRAAFFNSFKESICANPDKKPIRKLVPSSVSVARLKNNGITYGAIQRGTHLFYIKEPHKTAYLTNIAEFTSLWLLKNNKWKLSRVLSYNHRNPNFIDDLRFETHYPSPLFDDDNRIRTLLENHHVTSLAIGLIENGTLQQIRTFGVQKDSIPVTVDTQYKVASLTKPITALIALKLIQQGALDLDEPLYTYFTDPDIKSHPYRKLLTVRNILSHQSGLPNWRYLDTSNKLTFHFKPGTHFQYSGEGFEFLRKSIENKLQCSLDTLAQKHLFEPLGMKHTYFHWNTPIKIERYAYEHDEHGKQIPLKKYTQTSAAANLITTIQDYSAFVCHIMQGAGLSKSLYQEFLTPQIKEKEGIYRNLGMQLLPALPNGEIALMHTGGDYGTKAIFIMLQKSKKGIILFSNAENAMVVWRKVIVEYLGAVGNTIVKRNLK